MRNIMISFLTLFSMFGFYTQDETDVDIDKIENQSSKIILTLQATSDDLMVLEQDFTYNPNDFELTKVDYNSYFTYTEGKEKQNSDGTVTIKMLFDSTYAFQSIEYAKIYLTPLSNEVDSTVKIDNIKASDTNYNKENIYGSSFEIMESNNEVKLSKEKMTLQIQLKNWMLNHKTAIVILLVFLLVLCVVDKEVRALIKRKKEEKAAFASNMVANAKESTKKMLEAKQQNTNPKIFTAETPTNPADQTTITEQVTNATIQPNIQQNAEEIKEETQAQNNVQKIEEQATKEPISEDIYKGKYEVFIILLLVSSLLLVPKAFADNTDKTQAIRENIIEEKDYDSSLDYNNDNKVDIVDLVYSIGTTDVKNKGYINFNSGLENTNAQ